jgi:hypothetical protein
VLRGRSITLGLLLDPERGERGLHIGKREGGVRLASSTHRGWGALE